MFVGEGPGEQEDLRGEPFVGRAGQLLTQLIEGIGLTRADVYIANVVKCRPPRQPRPAARRDRGVRAVARPPARADPADASSSRSATSRPSCCCRHEGRHHASCGARSSPFARAGHDAVADPDVAPVGGVAIGRQGAGRVARRLRAREARAGREARHDHGRVTTNGRRRPRRSAPRSARCCARATSSCSAAISARARRRSRKALARGLGVARAGHEPDVHDRAGVRRPAAVAHVDVYRLDAIQELHDLGFEELLDDRRRDVVEWGDAIAPVLPSDRLDVRLDARPTTTPTGARSRSSPQGPSWARRRDGTRRRARRGRARLMLLLGIDTATRRVGVVLANEHGMLGRVELGGTAGTARPATPRRSRRRSQWCLRAVRGRARRSCRRSRSGSARACSPGCASASRRRRCSRSRCAIPVIPVPSLDLLAYPLRHAHGLVVATIDARRHELYWAMYRPVPGGVQRVRSTSSARPTISSPSSRRAARTRSCAATARCGSRRVRRRSAAGRARGPGARVAEPDCAGRARGRALRARGVLPRRRGAADVPAPERRRDRLGPEGRADGGRTARVDRPARRAHRRRCGGATCAASCGSRRRCTRGRGRTRCS